MIALVNGGPKYEGPEQFDIDRSSEVDAPVKWLKYLGRAGAVLLAAIMLVTLIVTSIGILRPANRLENTEEVELVPAHVTHVISGDKISVDIGGQLYTVRYLGVALPPYGSELFYVSMMTNREWVAGKQVLIERDITETNAYGELLRYVWIDDIMINAALIGMGLALHNPQSPDTKYSDGFARIQQAAKLEGIGLWHKEPVTQYQRIGPHASLIGAGSVSRKTP